MLKNESTPIMPIVFGRVLPLTSDKIHQNQEVYSEGGVICTIKATHYKDPPKVLVKEIVSDEETDYYGNPQKHGEYQ